MTGKNTPHVDDDDRRRFRLANENSRSRRTTARYHHPPPARVDLLPGAGHAPATRLSRLRRTTATKKMEGGDSRSLGQLTRLDGVGGGGYGWIAPYPFRLVRFLAGGGGLSTNNNIMGGDSARQVGRGGACCRMMYASRWGRPNVPPRVGWVGGGEGDISRRWRGDYTVRRLSLSGHNTNAKDNSPRCRAGGEEGASRRLWGVGYRPPSVVVTAEAVEAAERAVEVGAEDEERVDAEEEEGGDIWSMKAMIAATLRMILRSGGTPRPAAPNLPLALPPLSHRHHRHCHRRHYHHRNASIDRDVHRRNIGEEDDSIPQRQRPFGILRAPPLPPPPTQGASSSGRRNDNDAASSFVSSPVAAGGGISTGRGGGGGGVRFSSLLSRHLGLSRRQAERMVLTERVTLFGRVINSPSFELHPLPEDDHDDSNRRRGGGGGGGGGGSLAVKVDGKLVMGIEKTLGMMHAEMRRRSSSLSPSTTTVDIASRIGGPVGGEEEDDDDDDERSNDATANVRIWLANKLGGELVTEDDPVGRPSMLQRLIRGGVGKGGTRRREGDGGRYRPPPVHLKPVGRLDMMTEGLMIFTNDGGYARELELPKNSCWRTYRVRVHGRLTAGKMRAMRNGVTVRVDDNGNDNMGKSSSSSSSSSSKKKKKDEKRNVGGTFVDVVKTGRLMRYKGIKVSIERRNLTSSRGTRGSTSSSSSSSGGMGGGRGTNTWLRITCTEGKNRQLRRILESLGLDVTRLIRISYGDYDLNTIPPGMAIEVKCKRLEDMKRRGPLFVGGDKKKERRGAAIEDDEGASSVEWINYS
ncbi:hypothetical protein ACHAXA_009581 [Cyclostephanos tholiformis]|uniref:Pseudouridine synthase RsuA/RluA-like domain-containing protein n=1 Tax=Cyclostephanos tholiformis TaxID=382380 RepID=A0ABD3SDS6_9STRA